MPRQKGIDKLKLDYQILIDSREQHPWRFSRSIEKALPAGDYSIAYQIPERLLTYENIIAVERKSDVGELYSATGSERERFENELQKLSRLQYSFVICEFTLIDILNDAPPGKLEPQAVFGSIHSWIIRYGVQFIFAGNRQNARGSALKLFEFYFKYKILGVK
jgi:ERCC4-type nuclease